MRTGSGESGGDVGTGFVGQLKEDGRDLKNETVGTCGVLWWAVLGMAMAHAAPPSGYYASAEGKSGMTLRAALHVILSGHTNVPYSTNIFDTSDALMVLDEDPANTNNVFLTYAQRSEPKSTFAMTTGWDREHLWPNSYALDSVEPAYSDLRNLRAEDASVNSARGNKYYDISDTRSASYRHPAHAEAPLCSTDSNSCEPPGQVKGDIARALLYMMVRYTGDKAREPALFLTDATNQISATTNLMGRLTVLLRWHEEDPVDDRERVRDELIYTRFQGNRNPFVDRPEWVRLAFWPTVTFTPAMTLLIRVRPESGQVSSLCCSMNRWIFSLIARALRRVRGSCVLSGILRSVDTSLQTSAMAF